MTELLTTPARSVAWPEKDQPTGRPNTVALRCAAVERAIMAMHERLDEPLSLDAMAAVAIVSRYHFSRIFHQLTGLPPARFLATLRLAEAKRLLLTTPLSVTDICFRVGYNSLGAFTARFGQSVGISPGRFRQLRQVRAPLGVVAQEQAANRDAGGVVTGRVEAPAGSAGPVFVGLFTTPIPEGRPHRCAVLASPGEYRIEGVPTGSYHVFAISFPMPEEPMAMLLPDHNSLRVGHFRSPVRVSAGQRTERADLWLRSAALTDPPVLVSIPLLLAQAGSTILSKSYVLGDGEFPTRRRSAQAR